MSSERLRGRRIAITGASGFVGRHVMRGLLAEGASVVALVRDTDSLRDWNGGNVVALRWNLEEPRSGLEHLGRIDALCHLAALVPRDTSDAAYAEPCFRLNALGTAQLIEAIGEISPCQIVLASAGQFYRWSDQPRHEDEPLYPATRAPYYLTSLLAGEIFATYTAARRPGVSLTILRLGSIYGPGMAAGSTINRFIECARAGQPIVLRNGGRYRVDLVYVGDVVSAFIAALADEVDGVFNVGTGRGSSLAEVAGSVLRICGVSADLIRLEDGPADPGFAPLDVSRARDVLGLEPTPLELGLQHMISGPASALRIQETLHD
jgi:UDP-glucose 4-epimerase